MWTPRSSVQAISTKAQAPASDAGRIFSSGRAGHVAYAAGVTAILANLLLIAFYALQARRPEEGTYLGSASDLVGSLATAFMIPAALAPSVRLPDWRFGRIIRVVGLSYSDSGSCCHGCRGRS